MVLVLLAPKVIYCHGELWSKVFYGYHHAFFYTNPQLTDLCQTNGHKHPYNQFKKCGEKLAWE